MKYNDMTCGIQGFDKHKQHGSEEARFFLQKLPTKDQS